MRRAALSCLPVVDRERIVGILTERDLVEAVAKGVTPANAHVTDYMTDGGASIALDDDSTTAELKMLAIGCRHLPVVDGQRLVGMVSARDLYLAEAGAEVGDRVPVLAGPAPGTGQGGWPEEPPPDVDSEA
jgi:CBS domain-containing protein